MHIRKFTFTFVLAVFIFVTLSVYAQETENLAIVANGLRKPEASILPSLSIVNLDEPNLRQAVENEIIPLGFVIPTDLEVQGNLLYVLLQEPDPNFDPRGGSIEIINLLTRSNVGSIPIDSDTTPKQIALIPPSKAYVTGLYSNVIHVVDLNQKSVVKRIPCGPMPDGITILNGKAYVANSAYFKEPGTWNVSYEDTSNVTIIDIETDTVIKTIPMPINTNGITSDGVSTVVAVSAGIGAWNPQGPVPGTIVFIDAVTDEIEKTIELDGRAGGPTIDSMKRLFISSGGLLVYDLVSEAWTHDADNPFTDLGGVGAIDQSDNLYITNADWTGGRQDKLHVAAPDGTLLNTYGVGPGASLVTVAQVQAIGVATANVNHDGVVNILDLVLVASNFGQTGRNLQGDVNRDGIIDVFDLVRIAKYFGQDIN
ncbi:hypothetical protein C6502_20925 [Candidatus Poribacteria bacterium]|nr:MAG: hypothetical protein C6502_20925 [Candidatus Poribacteria bacterium]